MSSRAPKRARDPPRPSEGRLRTRSAPAPAQATRSSSIRRSSCVCGGFLAVFAASNEPVIPSVSEESPGWVARTPSLVPPYRGSLPPARDDSLCERDRDLFIPVPTTRGAVPTLGMTPGGQREPPTENSDGA